MHSKTSFVPSFRQRSTRGIQLVLTSVAMLVAALSFFASSASADHANDTYTATDVNGGFLEAGDEVLLAFDLVGHPNLQACIDAGIAFDIDYTAGFAIFYDGDGVAGAGADEPIGATGTYNAATGMIEYSFIMPADFDPAVSTIDIVAYTTPEDSLSFVGLGMDDCRGTVATAVNPNANMLITDYDFPNIVVDVADTGQIIILKDGVTPSQPVCDADGNNCTVTVDDPVNPVQNYVPWTVPGDFDFTVSCSGGSVLNANLTFGENVALDAPAGETCTVSETVVDPWIVDTASVECVVTSGSTCVAQFSNVLDAGRFAFTKTLDGLQLTCRTSAASKSITGWATQTEIVVNPDGTVDIVSSTVIVSETLSFTNVSNCESPDGTIVPAFSFSASCATPDAQIVAFDFSLSATATLESPLLPLGTQCTVTETSVDPLYTPAVNPMVFTVDAELTEVTFANVYTPLLPSIAIVKTAVAGADAACPAFADGSAGLDSLALDVGDAVTWCVTVINNGNADATNIVVTDDNGTPADAGDDREWSDVGPLAPGAELTFSYTSTVDGAGQVTNTAGVTMAETGENPTDPAQVTTTALLPSMAIVKTAVAGADAACPAFADGGAGLDSLLVDIGDAVTWCVVVINNGPGTATNIVVTDDSGTPGDVADDREWSDAGPLAAGQELTFSYSATVAAGTVTNTAGVTVAETEDNPTDPSVVTTIDLPSMAIVKTAVAGADADCPMFADGSLGLDSLLIEIGGAVTWCVTVINNGPGTATNIVVTDDSGTPNDPSDDLVGENPGPLAAGEQLTFGYSEQVTTAGQITNTAGVTVDETDDNPTDPAQVTTSALPSMAIVKTAVAGADAECPAFADGGAGLDVLDTAVGDVITWCVAVINNGPGAATDVVVVDDNATPSDQSDDRTWTDNGPLAAGEQVTFSYQTTISATGAITNTAGVTVAETTESPTDQAGTSTDGAPVIDVVKTVVAANAACPTSFAAGSGGADSLVVSAGTTVRYCVNVINLGPGDARNVVVTDNMGTTDLTDDETWSIGDLADGAEWNTSYTLVAGTSTVNNLATVTGTSVGGEALPEAEDLAVSKPPTPVTYTYNPPTSYTAPTYTAPPVVRSTPTPPLAITGAQSALSGAAAVTVIGLGGALVVIARRRDDG